MSTADSAPPPPDVSVDVDTVQRDVLSALRRCGIDVAEGTRAEGHMRQIAQGKGFLSYVGRVELDWSPPNDRLPRSVVLKLPHTHNVHKWAERGGTWETLYHTVVDNFYKVHLAEVTVYRNFGMQLTGLDAAHPKLPKCYAAVSHQDDALRPGYIVMEDLSEHCCSTDPKDGMNLAQCLATVEEIATLQAYSLNNTWHCPELCLTFVGMVMAGQEQMAKDWALPVVAAHGADIAALRRRIAGRNTQGGGARLRYAGAPRNAVHRDHGVPDVLVHGDCWEHNVLFEKDERGKASDTLACLVDWQISHMGNPAEDVARLLAFSVAPAVRLEHKERIVEYYYTRLVSKLRTAPPFTLPQFAAAFAHTYGAFATLFLPQYPQFLHLSECGQWAHTDDLGGLRRKMLADAAVTLAEVLRYMQMPACH